MVLLSDDRPSLQIFASTHEICHASVIPYATSCQMAQLRALFAIIQSWGEWLAGYSPDPNLDENRALGARGAGLLCVFAQGETRILWQLQICWSGGRVGPLGPSSELESGTPCTREMAPHNPFVYLAFRLLSEILIFFGSARSTRYRQWQSGPHLQNSQSTVEIDLAMQVREFETARKCFSSAIEYDPCSRYLNNRGLACYHLEECATSLCCDNLIRGGLSASSPTSGVFFLSEGFKWGVGSVGRWICKFGAPHFCLKCSPNPFTTSVFPQIGGKNGAPQICRSNAPRIQPPT